ncbi:AEN nuclease, partial [Corythaeola cristata]|nr:AEN nuclease [Corythaeola cristata]
SQKKPGPRDRRDQRRKEAADAAKRGPKKPSSIQPRGNGPAPVTQRGVAAQNGSSGTKFPVKTKAAAAAAARGTAKGNRRAPGGPPAPSKLLAIDCEMVGTGPGGRTSDLARCSIVGYRGD